MKINRGGGAALGALLWVAGALAAAAAPLIPVEDFVRAPQFTDAQLSPDGTALAYIVRQEESSGVGFLDLATMKADVVWARRPNLIRFKNDVWSFEWVSSERIVMQTTFGWAGVNRDLTHFTYLSGEARWSEERMSGMTMNRFSPLGIVYNSGRDPTHLLVISNPKPVWGEIYPEVLRLNTMTGSFSVVQANPGMVRSWIADWDGNIRFGLLDDGVNTQLIHRAGTGAPWSKPIDFGRDTKSFGLAGLDGDGRTLYFFKPSVTGRKALYAYDLTEGTISAPLFRHEKYDVDSAIFSPKYRRLLGVRYDTEGPRQYWFEPELAKLQKEIDAAHPGVVNQITSMDWEMRHLLIRSFSARESGYYTLLDLGTHKSRVIAMSRPWLKAEDMAEMHPVKCLARDGLELHGYLTLPPGRGPKNLATVVFVHGGPYGPRDHWGFDPVVQFLASRGYAVLQVDYRGSGGYGVEFYDRGRHEIGGKIQDDIVDVIRWAVKQGVADPRRLAIMGASYGGYSTLFALATTPDLFRCGVACMAVSDWGALIKDRESDQGDYRDAIRFWNVQIGDLTNESDRRHLAAVSPINLAATMKAPLLIMHGEDDTTVPIDQAKRMVSALKKAGHPPETIFFEDTGHWWPVDKKGVQFFKKLEAFLATNLKAD